ncbi:MAG: S8 family serine peptidase [Thermoanaerobaculia bacterium]
MADIPRRTVLDASLSSLADRAGAPPGARGAVPLQVATTRDLLGEPPLPSPERVSLKLLVAETEAEASQAWVEGQGGQVLSSRANVLVAELPPEALSGLEGCPGIRRAEAPRQLQANLDEARGPATGLQAALQSFPLDGQGVVVGLVDTGLDWRHPDFQNPNGSSRLELFAHAHFDQATQRSTFDQFDPAALDAALGGGGAVPQGDPMGHGTHCASIAAGNGLASNGRYRGVAPGAALMAVRSEPLLDTHTIWGIRRIFELAGARPAVVSLSLGSHLGPHDGTTAIENVIARESGPGRIVVVAAGNEGGDRIHFRGELTAGQELVIPVRIDDPSFQFVDVWVVRGDEVSVLIETPDGAQHPADGQEVRTVFGTFEAHFQEDPINRDQNLTLFVAGGRRNHIWKIRLAAARVVHGEVHAWAGSNNGSSQLFGDGADSDFTVGMPGTEERAVTVASVVSKNRFETAQGVLSTPGLAVGGLSPFSSRGPTRYGGLKPDIAAPGQYITAALAGGSEMATQPRFLQRHDPSGKYISIQGTSMATPFVAGLIALLLQREPRLTPEEIQQRLRITARRDAQTGRVWDRGWGFGKLDAAALLAYQG